MTSTSSGTWPTYKAQQRICKRGDTVLCLAAGASGWELCTPCRYTDEELAARRLPVEESRTGHAERIASEPGNGHICPAPMG
jgi:hypothetical protein